MQTEIPLTERQQEILITAAIDHDGHLEPAAASINIRGGAFTNMMHTLRNAGLVEGEDAETRLTPAGYAAISVDAPAPEEPAMQENSEPTENDESATENTEEIVEAAPEVEEDAAFETEVETVAAPEREATPESETAPESTSEPEPETPAKPPRKPRTGTKQATVVDMLKRNEGATLTQIIEATGWQEALPHTPPERFFRAPSRRTWGFR